MAFTPATKQQHLQELNHRLRDFENELHLLIEQSRVAARNEGGVGFIVLLPDHLDRLPILRPVVEAWQKAGWTIERKMLGQGRLYFF